DFFRGLLCLAEFLPEQRARRHRTSRVLFLEGFELSLQLPQRKRHAHLRRDEKRLDKKHRPEKGEHPENEQSEAQSRPAFTGRIREHEGSKCAWRDFLHEPPIFAHSRENKSAVWMNSRPSSLSVGRWTFAIRRFLQVFCQLSGVISQQLRRSL